LIDQKRFDVEVSVTHAGGGYSRSSRDGLTLDEVPASLLAAVKGVLLQVHPGWEQEQARMLRDAAGLWATLGLDLSVPPTRSMTGWSEDPLQAWRLWAMPWTGLRVPDPTRSDDELREAVASRYREACDQARSRESALALWSEWAMDWLGEDVGPMTDVRLRAEVSALLKAGRDDGWYQWAVELLGFRSADVTDEVLRDKVAKRLAGVQRELHEFQEQDPAAEPYRRLRAELVEVLEPLTVPDAPGAASALGVLSLPEATGRPGEFVSAVRDLVAHTLRYREIAVNRRVLLNRIGTALLGDDARTYSEAELPDEAFRLRADRDRLAERDRLALRYEAEIAEAIDAGEVVGEPLVEAVRSFVLDVEDRKRRGREALVRMVRHLGGETDGVHTNDLLATVEACVLASPSREAGA
jgi:hypothetical protein